MSEPLGLDPASDHEVEANSARLRAVEREPITEEPEGPERFLVLGADPEHNPILEWRHLRIPVDEVWDEDLIPDPGSGQSQPHTHRENVREHLNRTLGILAGYQQWCGKSVPKGRGSEGIKVSCPVPGHEDRNPSAWLNTDKDLGNCALCGGFDIIDLYAMTHGWAFPSYKATSFAAVHDQIAAEFGLAVINAGSDEAIAIPREELSPARDAPAAPASDQTAPVADPPGPLDALPDPEDDDPGKLLYFPNAAKTVPIDWRNLLDRDSSTFLWDFMETGAPTDSPEEFFFWSGLVALGLAAGNRVRMVGQRGVRPNLMVCLVAPSGAGKSNALVPMKELVRSSGIRLSDPESSQAVHKNLLDPELDEEDSKIVVRYRPVRMLIHVDEFSTIAGRSARSGATLKQALMSLYDSPAPWGADAKIDSLPQAEGHFVSTITTSQTQVLGQILERRDAMSGFLNRWVFTLGTVKEPDPFDFEVPVDYERLGAKLAKIESWAMDFERRHPEGMDWERAARELWKREYYARGLNNFRNGTLDDADAYTRVEVVLKKLMLLFAIDSRSTVITAQHVRQALVLMPHLMVGYDFVSGETVASEEVKDENRMIARIMTLLEDNEPKGYSDVKRYGWSGTALAKMGGVKVLKRTLDFLVSAGDLMTIRVDNREHYVLNNTKTRERYRLQVVPPKGPKK